MTAAQLPPTLTPNPEGIPAKLRERSQWVVFITRLTGRVKHGRPKLDKIPLSPGTLKAASTTDPATWGTFDQALATLRTGKFAGIGYVFSEDDPYTGIDLDGCIDPETGEIAAWARAIIERFASYTEVSVSRTGLHLIVRGVLPEGWRKIGDIEAYDNGRFFTMSGHHLDGTPAGIENRAAVLTAWHAEIAAAHGKEPAPAASDAPTPTRPGAAVPPDDAELLARAQAAANGAKFRALWAGEWHGLGYASQSDADLALVNLLLYWTDGDPGRVDRLFRQSGLMRPKWDERRGALTYGERTITVAVQTYQPRAGGGISHPPAGGDSAIGAPAWDDELPPDAGDSAAAHPPNPCAGRVAALEHEVADLRQRLGAKLREVMTLRRENRQLRAERTQIMAVLRNKDIKAEKAVIMATIFEVASQISRGKDYGGSGLCDISLGHIAENAGCSNDTASRHLTRGEEWGIFEKELTRRERQKIDHETGEVTTEWHSQLRVQLTQPTVIDALRTLANLHPERPSTWGGARPGECPKHPRASTYERITRSRHCTVCDRKLAEEELDPQTLAPRTGPLNPHLADSDNSPLTVDTVTIGPHLADSGPACAGPEHEQGDGLAGVPVLVAGCGHPSLHRGQCIVCQAEAIAGAQRRAPLAPEPPPTPIQVLELAKREGWPRVQIVPGQRAGPGAAAWRWFVQRAGSEQLRAAYRELARREGAGT